MRILQRGPFAAVLVLFAILALACGLGDKLKEQASEEVFEHALDQAGVDGDIDIDIGGAVDVSDLPEWLAYPNASATGKLTMAQDGAEGTMYILESDDPKATVQSWYTTALSTWQQTATFESEGGTQLVYTDGATSAVQLTLAETEGHTTISCWYAKGAEPETEVQQAVDPSKPRPHPRQGLQTGPGHKMSGPGKGIKAKRAGGR